MKKEHFFTIILLLQIIFIQSPQMLFARDFHVGVKGGLSIPNLQGGNSEESKGYQSRLGPDFGVFTDMSMTRHFAIEVDLLYVGQGGKKQGMQPVPSGSLSDLPVPPDMTLYAKFKNESILNYIEIPILAKYSSNVGNLLTVNFDVGPNFGILVNAKTKTSGMSAIFIDNSGTPLTIEGQPIPPVDFGGETSIKSDINELNIGIAGGLGISRELGPGQILLDGRGSYGLTNTQKGTENGKNHTGCLVITLGYAIKI